MYYLHQSGHVHQPSNADRHTVLVKKGRNRFQFLLSFVLCLLSLPLKIKKSKYLSDIDKTLLLLHRGGMSTMSFDISDATNAAMNPSLTPHALSLAEPSIRDFALNEPDCLYCDDVARILAWMEHTNYLLSIARKDPDLRHNLDDISSLILRKSVLASCLEDFESAKSYALEALDVQHSALGYFRLGCAQYCLSEFKGAMESFLSAERLEPVNAHIQRALSVCMARAQSVKDRVPVVASAL